MRSGGWQGGRVVWVGVAAMQHSTVVTLKGRLVCGVVTAQELGLQLGMQGGGESQNASMNK